MILLLDSVLLALSLLLNHLGHLFLARFLFLEEHKVLVGRDTLLLQLHMEQNELTSEVRCPEITSYKHREGKVEPPLRKPIVMQATPPFLRGPQSIIEQNKGNYGTEDVNQGLKKAKLDQSIERNIVLEAHTVV